MSHDLDSRFGPNVTNRFGETPWGAALDYSQTGVREWAIPNAAFIADATRQGRRREFARFAGFSGEVPDPQDEATFERSKLTAGEPEQLYARLLGLRRELPPELEVACDEEARTLELRRGRARLRADFLNDTVNLDA